MRHVFPLMLWVSGMVVVLLCWSCAIVGPSTANTKAGTRSLGTSNRNNSRHEKGENSLLPLSLFRHCGFVPAPAFSIIRWDGYKNRSYDIWRVAGPAPLEG